MECTQEDSWVLQGIDRAKELHPWMKEILDDLEECYREKGCPEEPGGPSTGTTSPVHLFQSPGDMGEGATNKDMDLYNSAMTDLYYCLGYVHVGGDNWDTQWRTTPEWSAYQEAARNLLDDWVAGEAWNLFCNWQW